MVSIYRLCKAGLFIPTSILVTIITYGLKTLIYFKHVLNIYMVYLYCIRLMILNMDPMLIKVLVYNIGSLL